MVVVSDSHDSQDRPQDCHDPSQAFGSTGTVQVARLVRQHPPPPQMTSSTTAPSNYSASAESEGDKYFHPRAKSTPLIEFDSIKRRFNFSPARKSFVSTSASGGASSGSGEGFHGISKYAKGLFVVYILVSLCYTLVHFYTLLVSSPPAVGHSATIDSNSHSVYGKIVLDHKSRDPHSLWTGRFSVLADGDSEHDDSDLEEPFSDVSDSQVYSKMFQYALQPTRVVPHFFKMHSAIDRDDITLSTMITMERLEVFNNLVDKYQGPISVAVHINDNNEKLHNLEILHKFRKDHPNFAEYVDLHLVVDRYDRQFNYWRNVARFFARTDLIMMMDVDFLLCSDLHTNFRNLGAEYKAMLLNASAVFVAPAFEFSKTAVELSISDYPRTKEALKSLYDRGDAVMFHDNWQRGHGPTDYKQWFTRNEPYQIHAYNYNYEPYVVMRRDGLPWCDERFVGYGSNKAACLYEIFLAGVQFWVMPQDFLIHQRHPYPENDRRVERKYNKRLYDAYREESCYRYARMQRGVPDLKAVDSRICGSDLPNFYGL